MMSFVNTASKWDSFPLEGRRIFTLLLAPFAPHLAEELWQTQVSQAKDIIWSRSPCTLIATTEPEGARERSSAQVAVGEGSVSLAAWPEVQAPAAAEEEYLAVAVQFNGKTRGVLELPSSQAQDEAAVLTALRGDEKFCEMKLEEGAVKTVFVGGRVLNFVHPKANKKHQKKKPASDQQ